MSSILVVGGSGMLAGASNKLQSTYDHVGVVARHADKIEAIAGTKIVPLLCDYHDIQQLVDVVDSFCNNYGKPKYIVSWIHGTSPNATMAIASFAQSHFFEVTGHPGNDNYEIALTHKRKITQLGLTHTHIVLGGKGHRWLTHEEISNGVLEAMDNPQPTVVIGRLQTKLNKEST